MLTQKQSRFGFEYCKDYNGTKAAIRAGYSEAGAGDTGSRLLLNPDVQKRISEREEEIAAEAEVDRAWVFKEWCDIAKADPRELMQLVVRACPRCWPEGLGLDVPNPCCPLPQMIEESNVGGCGGRGVQMVKLTPTNQLSRRAARLIASIKETKNGIEYKLRDQDAAVNNIANALGVLKPAAASASISLNLGTTGEATDWKNLSDEELDMRIAIEEEKERAKALSEGTSEGTLALVDGNPSDVN